MQMTVVNFRGNEIFEKNVGRFVDCHLKISPVHANDLNPWKSFSLKKGSQYYAVSDAVFCGCVGE